VAVIGQLGAASVTQHVGVGIEAEIGRRKASAALRCKHQRRAVALSLTPPQLAQFAAR